MRVLIVKIDQEHFQLTDNQLRNRVLKSIYIDSAKSIYSIDLIVAYFNVNEYRILKDRCGDEEVIKNLIKEVTKLDKGWC